MTETITHVACRRANGEIVSLPAPNRHFHIAEKLRRETAWKLGDPPLFGGGQDQGFLTSTGRYVDRREALRIAAAADQLLPDAQPKFVGNDLFSEDVW